MDAPLPLLDLRPERLVEKIHVRGCLPLALADIGERNCELPPRNTRYVVLVDTADESHDAPALDAALGPTLQTFLMLHQATRAGVH